MSSAPPSPEDQRNREMFKAMFNTPLEYVRESLDDLGLACQRLLEKIVETAEKNKATGIGLKGFKAGTNFMPMVVLSAADINTVVAAVGRRGRTDDLFAHLAVLFKGMELHNYPEIQDLKILGACLLTRLEKGATTHKLYENKSQRSLLDVMTRCTNNEVFDGLVEVVLLTMQRGMDQLEQAVLGIGSKKKLMTPRDLLAWEGVMYIKCTKRLSELPPGSESQQRMHLLMTRICDFLVLYFQKIDAKDSASEDLFNSCLTRCHKRVMDSGCPDSIRFVHLATIAKLSLLERWSSSLGYTWGTILASGPCNAMHYVLELLPRAMEGEWDSLEAEPQNLLPRISATLELLSRALPLMKPVDKRWSLLLMGCIWPFVKRLTSSKEESIANEGVQAGQEHFNSFVESLIADSLTILEDYEDAYSSAPGVDQPAVLTFFAEIELTYMAKLVKVYASHRSSSMPVCQLFIWNLRIATACLCAEGLREGFLDADLLDEESVHVEDFRPHFWNRHTDGKFAAAFHSIFMVYQENFTSNETEPNLLLPQKARIILALDTPSQPSRFLLQMYARLVVDGLLTGAEVEEGVKWGTGVLESVCSIDDPMEEPDVQFLWLEHSFRLRYFCQAAICLATWGRKHNLDQEVVRAATEQIKDLAEALQYCNDWDGWCNAEVMDDARLLYRSICRFLASPVQAVEAGSPAAPPDGAAASSSESAGQAPVPELPSASDQSAAAEAEPQLLQNGTRNDSSGASTPAQPNAAGGDTLKDTAPDSGSSKPSPTTRNDAEAEHPGGLSSGAEAGIAQASEQTEATEKGAKEAGEGVEVRVMCTVPPKDLQYPPKGEKQLRGPHSVLWQSSQEQDSVA